MPLLLVHAAIIQFSEVAAPPVQGNAQFGLLVVFPCLASPPDAFSDFLLVPVLSCSRLAVGKSSERS